MLSCFLTNTVLGDLGKLALILAMSVSLVITFRSWFCRSLFLNLPSSYFFLKQNDDDDDDDDEDQRHGNPNELVGSSAKKRRRSRLVQTTAILLQPVTKAVCCD